MKEITDVLKPIKKEILCEENSSRKYQNNISIKKYGIQEIGNTNKYEGYSPRSYSPPSPGSPSDPASWDGD